MAHCNCLSRTCGRSLNNCPHPFSCWLWGFDTGTLIEGLVKQWYEVGGEAFLKIIWSVLCGVLFQTFHAYRLFPGVVGSRQGRYSRLRDHCISILARIRTVVV